MARELVVVGIDPGKTGAVATLTSNGADVVPIWVRDETTIDASRLLRFLLDTEPSLVVVEKVGATPKFGSKSSFTFGRIVGAIEAAVTLAGFPVRYVRPQDWKQEVLKGTKRDKAAAIAWVRNRYPLLSLKATPADTTDSHDLAEAVCLAEYGRRELRS